MPSATVYVSLVLLFHLTTMEASVEAKCENQCHCFLGEQILIPCRITETCSWPLWMKGDITITNEGYPDINPVYSARYSIDTDNQTLIINKVEKSDEGIYKCFLLKEPNSPEAVEVIVEEPFNACGIKITNIAFFLLAEVVIIIQYVILIWTYAVCKQNENKNEDKLKKIKNVVHTAVSKLNLTIAAVPVLITVAVCFIMIMTFAEDCEKLTEKKYSVRVSLLVVGIIVCVLGVIILMVNQYLVMKRKNARGYSAQYTKDTSDNHVTGGDTVSIKENAEVPNTEKLLKELEKEGSVND